MSKEGRLSRFLPRFFRSESKAKIGKASADIKGPSCTIVFLDDSEQNIAYKNNWKGQILFDHICDQLSLSERVFFGLRFLDHSGQAHWLDLGKSVSSQLKGCSAEHPKLYFIVKFYIADPCKLRDEITRYLYFLQVKKDILQGRLPVTFADAAELCAYALQSELGDFDARVHTHGYVSEFIFVPSQTEELEGRIAKLHRQCQGATPAMAEQKYLEKVKWLEMYGVDLHCVQVCKDTDPNKGNYFLGVSPIGIVVYKNRTKIGNHFWPRITNASHKGKVFSIKVKDKNNDERVYAFELSTKSACKHLWKCCVDHRAFFSERSERLVAYESRSGMEPRVHRTPSRRKPRRVNSDSRLNTEFTYLDHHANYDQGAVIILGQPEPARTSRHRSFPELQGRQSPRSVKSAPWESSKCDQGLYTSGCDTPTSEWQINFTPAGSDNGSGISQRKRYFPNHKSSDIDSDGSAARRRRPHPFHDKDINSQGSIPSIHSAPTGGTKQRRRRVRTKSPGNTKRPPEELKQHIEFDLVDTEGMTDEQLKVISYTKVETKASLFRIKYSPKFRHKIWESRRKSFGDADRNSGSRQEERTQFSRQDSNHTDPVKRSNGSEVDFSDGRHFMSQGSPYNQEFMSHTHHHEQIKGNNSSPRSYQSHTENPYNSSDDHISSHILSDSEQTQISGSREQHYRYEQHRFGHNKQAYENHYGPYESSYRQNHSEFRMFSQQPQRINPNSERQTYSERDKYGSRPSTYNYPIKNTSGSAHSYGYYGSPESRLSGRFSTAGHPAPENIEAPDSYLQNPNRYNDTASKLGASAVSKYSEAFLDSQRGNSPSPRYGESLQAGPQRGSSTFYRYESPVLGFQRGVPNPNKYSEISPTDPPRPASNPNRHSATPTKDLVRPASTPNRYSEIPATGPQRRAYNETLDLDLTLTPPRANARVNYHQQSRPSSQYYEDQNLPEASYHTQLKSDGICAQNIQTGPSDSTSFQQKRYTHSSHHDQFGDRQKNQMSSYGNSQPLYCGGNFPNGHGTNSGSQESPTVKPGYLHHQQAYSHQQPGYSQHSNQGYSHQQPGYSQHSQQGYSQHQQPGYSQTQQPVRFRSELMTQI